MRGEERERQTFRQDMRIAGERHGLVIHLSRESRGDAVLRFFVSHRDREAVKILQVGTIK